MKTLRFLAVAGMIAIAGTASAQFVNSGSTTATTQSTQRTGARLIKDTRDYNRFEFGYLPSTLVQDWDGADDLKMKGFEIGYLHGFNLTSKLPLFLEVGGQFQLRTWKDSEEESDEYGSLELTNRMNIFSLNIPVNLAYRLNITNDFAITPYFGFDFRINLLGKDKYKIDVSGEYADYKDEIEDELPDDINLFDKDDMGGSDYVYKRFQAGWHIGVNLDWKALHFGVNYGTDMSEISEDRKVKTTTVALGFNF